MFVLSAVRNMPHFKHLNNRYHSCCQQMFVLPSTNIYMNTNTVFLNIKTVFMNSYTIFMNSNTVFINTRTAFYELQDFCS